MNIPLFSKVKKKPPGRRVVRASARALRGSEEEYYEAEPNMKLSHAFMVVLVLHVVAVGGIYAFNEINKNKGGSSSLLENITGKIARVAGASTVAPVAAPVLALPPPPVVVAQRQPGDADEPLPPLSRQTPVVTSKAPTAASGPSSGAASSASRTYKVQGGDNPYSIARKFGVTSAAILSLNGIEDPRKLQIGQVLRVPQKAN